MKMITYRLMTEVNRGTEEEPIIERVFTKKSVMCADSRFEENLAIARMEAYEAEVKVEDLPDEEPEPTIEDLAAQLVEADLVACDLYEQQLEQEEINNAQDESLCELYEMIGG